MTVSDKCESQMSEPYGPSMHVLKVAKKKESRSVMRIISNSKLLGLVMSYNKLHCVLISYETLTINDSMKPCNLQHRFDNEHKECCDKPVECSKNAVT
jgi:hypothetical protein